jgi:GNAT superfamily N-acetyltransferase
MSVSVPRVIVRRASREDIPYLVTISRTSVADGEDVGFGGPVAESVFEDPIRLGAAWTEPNRIGSEEIFVAEMDGRVVGLVKIEDRGADLELVDIDVARELQGQGIGTHLVQFVEGHARSLEKMAVTLGTSRKADGTPWKSLPWWESRGYRITHEEENAWTRSIGPGVREIRMRKDLR